MSSRRAFQTAVRLSSISARASVLKARNTAWQPVLTASSRALSTKTTTANEQQQQQQQQQLRWQPTTVYEGALAKSAKVMKFASVASLVGASAAIPFFFLGDSDVPSAARTVLAATTIGMTASSTAIVTWALKPYITSLRVLKDQLGQSDNPGSSPDLDITSATPLLIETMTFLAQPRTRLVFPEQLVPSTLPLTSWIASEPSEALVALSKDILRQINDGRKKDIVQLARAGDTFYAHTQGPVSAGMQKILEAAPSQD